jgi:hypothetical protein
MPAKNGFMTRPSDDPKTIPFHYTGTDKVGPRAG